MAWVPPLYFDTDIPLPNFSYSNASNPMRFIAPHDPIYARQDRASGPSAAQEWVRPDFVVKVDDDSFVMLAELEARLRVALHENRTEQLRDKHWDNEDSSVVSSSPGHDRVTPSSSEVQRLPSNAFLTEDPLIYWGYLVKRRFMAGELYALSWSLVDWVSRDPAIKGLVRGAEDKQTAKWMQLHPRAAEVRWVAERCWIYDHPRSGTVCVFFFVCKSFCSLTHNTVGVIDTPMDFCFPLRPLAPGRASERSLIKNQNRSIFPRLQRRTGTIKIGGHPRNGPDRACRNSELGTLCRFPT